MSCYLEEKNHLEKIEQELADSLKQLEAGASHYEKEYRAAKRYLADYWNEMDSMERFSNERSIDQLADGGEGVEEQRRKVEVIMNSPYFGRVDFHFDGEEEPEAIYVGRFGFCDQWGQSLIYDWRAPVCSLYYDFELERGSFEAPLGRMEGDILLKRQLKVKDGELLYALESAVAISDETLRDELSQTSDERMKTIIATIQKEQNQIIRNTRAYNLVIQGAAGSGKTSIALHRAAYLLYRFRDKLPVGSVAIFSPNKVFADYISTVLPELGEEPLLELTFKEVAQEEIGQELFCSWEAATPDALFDLSEPEKKRIAFKTSREFLTAAEAYWKSAEMGMFKARTLTFGSVVIDGAYTEKRYWACKHLPVRKRFGELAKNILERCKSEGRPGEKPPTAREIERKLEGMCRMKHTLQLYEDFYLSTGREDFLLNPGSREKEWWDVYPYLYFKGLFEGFSSYGSVKHVIIDEMQDYAPVQYVVVNGLFPCRKTILGDFSQKIDGFSDMDLDHFQKLFDGVEIVEITKSYRSTKEIMELAKRVNPQSRAEPLARHGEKPEVLRFENHQEELEYLRDRIEGFEKEKSGGTMALLVRSQMEATKLVEDLRVILKGKNLIHLLSESDSQFAGGITVSAVTMAKGLEFDEVIVPFADESTYKLEDSNLLYVACTRAMHRLTVTAHRPITRLIGDTY